MEEDRLPPAMLRDVDQGAMGGIAAAPVLVVVCSDTRLAFAQSMPSSIFPAVQNLLLAAHALGLGSTLTTLPALAGDELSDPARPPARSGAGRRRAARASACSTRAATATPAGEKAHLERYGTPFPPANASKNPQ